MYMNIFEEFLQTHNMLRVTQWERNQNPGLPFLAWHLSTRPPALGGLTCCHFINAPGQKSQTSGPRDGWSSRHSNFVLLLLEV